MKPDGGSVLIICLPIQKIKMRYFSSVDTPRASLASSDSRHGTDGTEFGGLSRCKWATILEG